MFDTLGLTKFLIQIINRDGLNDASTVTKLELQKPLGLKTNFSFYIYLKNNILFNIFRLA